MKIRTDFITNSSSTNFIIISKNEIKEDALVKLLGFNEDSPFVKHLEEMICEAIYRLESADDFFNHSYYIEEYQNLETFIKKHFSSKTYERFLKAKKANENVYIGSFSSDEAKFSGFFCIEPILIKNDDIYFDAIECSW